VRLGFMLTVLPAAGLPCAARDKVGPSNSFRGCAAALKQVGPVRWTMHAARAHLATALLGVTKAPRHTPPQPFIAPLA